MASLSAEKLETVHLSSATFTKRSMWLSLSDSTGHTSQSNREQTGRGGVWGAKAAGSWSAGVSSSGRWARGEIISRAGGGEHVWPSEQLCGLHLRGQTSRLRLLADIKHQITQHWLLSLSVPVPANDSPSFSQSAHELLTHSVEVYKSCVVFKSALHKDMRAVMFPALSAALSTELTTYTGLHCP